MIAFRVRSKPFVQIGNAKFYPERKFPEQAPDGTYVRPYTFFAKHRFRMLRWDIELMVSDREMEVRYVGHTTHIQKVRVGDVDFPHGKWVKVPLDFDSRDWKGQDLFLVLGFRFRSPNAAKTSLEDISDGDSILLLRKYGGLGDIIMQSMLFPDIRERFPNSHITYAIPRHFMPIFDGCADIDAVVDSADVEQKLYRLILSGEYGFIGDMSTSCSAYECEVLNRGGVVDKQRQDIWAESIDLELDNPRTCIRLEAGELLWGKRYLERDGRPIIGIAPMSANIDRSYPYRLCQPLIDGLVEEGCKVVLLHNADLGYENCLKATDLNLRELGSVIGNLDALISVDTGQLHYAGVLGVPVVALFGVTDTRARLAYYDAVGIQGECERGEEPCWGRKSAVCRKVYSEGKVNPFVRMKIASDTASCMYVDPAEVIAAVRGILSAKSPNRNMREAFA